MHRSNDPGYTVLYCLFVYSNFNFRDNFWSDSEAILVFEMVMSVPLSVCLRQQFSLATAFSSIVGKLMTLSNFTCMYSLLSTIHCGPCVWPWPLTCPVSRSNVNLRLSPFRAHYIDDNSFKLHMHLRLDEHYPLPPLSLTSIFNIFSF